MAKLFGSQVDLQKIPILNIVIHSASSAPSSPVNGQLWYDTTGNRLNVRENGAWVLASQTGALTTASTAGGDLSGTFSNLQIAANAVGTTEIANSAVTYAKIQNVSATDRILGRDTAGAGVIEELTVTGGVEFTGTGIQTSALTGDVTKTAGGTALTIANDVVNFAKMQNIATDRLIGRDTAATGDPEEIAVSGGLEWTGAAGIQRSALTGDVTATAGSNATTIAAGAVTVAKLNSAVTLASIAAASASAGSITASSQLITNVLDPVNPQDAATKAYVDAARAGLDVKASVHFASTANVSGTYNATNGTSARGQFTAMSNAAIDGVTPAAGDRVLLKDQSTGAQNGIWVITTLGTGANGVWDRATDFDADAEVTPGAFTFVEEGTANGDSGWVLTNNAPVVIGGGSGSALVFAQFSGAGSIVAGAGLTKTGSTIDAIGTTNRISVAADSIDISSAYVGQATITTLGTITTGVWTGTDIAVTDGGTGSSTAAGARTNLGATGKYSADLTSLSAGVEATITHNLGTTDVHAMFRTTADGKDTLMDWRVIDSNSCGVTADVAYGAAAVRVVVIG